MSPQDYRAQKNNGELIKVVCSSKEKRPLLQLRRVVCVRSFWAGHQSEQPWTPPAQQGDNSNSIESLSSHTCTYQIHVVFRLINQRCRWNSSSRCCYRAREHVDPAWSRRVRQQQHPPSWMATPKANIWTPKAIIWTGYTYTTWTSHIQKSKDGDVIIVLPSDNLQHEILRRCLIHTALKEMKGYLRMKTNSFCTYFLLLVDLPHLLSLLHPSCLLHTLSPSLLNSYSAPILHPHAIGVDLSSPPWLLAISKL